MDLLTKIDLHMHSTCSDGTDTPEQLLENVRKAGITFFSVTDHDSVEAAGMMADIRSVNDPFFISGVELSCKDEDGQYHILGYAIDPQARPIRNVVHKAHNIRMDKVAMRLRKLKEDFGITFPEEEVELLLAQPNPGKPHIGNLMVRYGYTESKEQAFREYLNDMRIPSGYVRPEEAIKAILDSGGVPVLAHPFYGSGDQLILGAEMEERLRKLVRFGLEGTEAYYSGFTEKLTRQMLALADAFGLYVTAGSDYHGTNKMVKLGETGLEETTERPENLRRFIGRIMK
ncbi:MAG: PHP domain-containing protein [Lachnospiraceae bacterium]|nr:PHP domain-containing protein [Lachnospiraceae bacterium]